MNGKTLVAYFSATGTTAGVARRIAEAVEADVYEIRPSVPYTEKDLDWTNKKSRSSVEMGNRNCRPEIAESVGDMSQYGTVLIGFPIWWYREPSIIDTFLESYEFSGKRMAAFATSGGSGIEGAEKELRRVCPKAEWAEGRLLNRGDGAEWARSVIEG